MRYLSGSLLKLSTSFHHVLYKFWAGFVSSGSVALFVCAGAGAGAGASAREHVAVSRSYPAGTIIIKQSERKLYFTTGTGTAIRYPIAIGRAGKAWQGETFVQGKYFSPAWSAPAVVRQDHPNFPAVIPGGSPRNPMGAAAITLNLSEVAIHGTTVSMRKSVGTAASYGCIRMYNEDVMDLYHHVEVGTPVVAIP
jgi:lipoprotein-anchoring transpeptidase ErfK/SrfK